MFPLNQIQPRYSKPCVVTLPLTQHTHDMRHKHHRYLLLNCCCTMVKRIRGDDPNLAFVSTQSIKISFHWSRFCCPVHKPLARNDNYACGCAHTPSGSMVSCQREWYTTALAERNLNRDAACHAQITSTQKNKTRRRILDRTCNRLCAATAVQIIAHFRRSH